MSKKIELNNLSNGETDGIVLFYLKNGSLHPILLNEEQAIMLDMVIATPFAESKLRVAPSIVEYEAIKHMIER